MKMLYIILFIIVAVIVLSYLLFYFIDNLITPKVQQFSLGTVCVKEHCFKVELAKTQTQRERGLMYRKELDKDKGMLFIFDKEGIFPFWMKNTLIPLDMIWIDGNNKAVFISQNVQPCKSLICPSIYPAVKAKYILEVNAGIVKKINLKIGDEVALSI